MRITGLLIAMLLLELFLMHPAQAYNSEIGHRAPDIGGWDIVHHRHVQLGDYFGQWVLLEFSAMWCGPCNKSLPEFLKQTKPYRDSGKLAVVMVSCDSPETLPRAKNMIRDNHIDFPVLYDGGDFDSIPVQEWCHGDTLCFGIPYTALVNPHGVVVAVDLSRQNLAAELDFYLNSGRPVVGLRSYHYKNEDGSYTFVADMMNPGREPVEIVMDLFWEEWLCDPEDPERITTDIERHCEANHAHAPLSFDDFGEASFKYTFTPAPNQDIFGYEFRAVLPGSPGAPGLDEQGIGLRTGLSQAFQPGIEWREADEHYHVLPD